MFHMQINDKNQVIEFTGQSVVSFTHFLSKRPSIQVFDENDEEILCTITESNGNMVECAFFENGAPKNITGRVVLN